MNKIFFFHCAIAALPMCAMESKQKYPEETLDLNQPFLERFKDLNSLRELLNKLEIKKDPYAIIKLYQKEQLNESKPTEACNCQQENELITTISDRIEEWVKSTKEVETSFLVLKNKWTNREDKIIKTQVVLIKHPRAIYRNQPDLPLDARRESWVLLEKEWRAHLGLALLRESHLQPSYWRPKNIFEILYSASVEVSVTQNVTQNITP
jgi:hypothetical protein